MSALSIQPTYPIFTETNGLPLENGYIWIGAANLDPQTNPINVYWDAAFTEPAGQPIRTLNGYLSKNGTPARLFVNENYSIRVQNSKGSLVYNAPQGAEVISAEIVTFVGFKGQVGTVSDLAGDDGADWIGFEPADFGTGAVAVSVQDKLRESVSVKDFGASPSATASENTTAIQSALNNAAGKYRVYLPGGTYMVNATIRIPSNTYFYGDGESSIIKMVSTEGRDTTVVLTGARDDKRENIVIENMTIDFNRARWAVGGGTRLADSLYGGFQDNNSHALSICYSEYVLVRGVSCIDGYEHCLDVAAPKYVQGNNGATYDPQPSRFVRVEDCYFSGGGDDNFTTHHSSDIWVVNCLSENPSGVLVPGNSNCFEIDDGSRNVMMTDCVGIGGSCGLQIKGHNYAPAPYNVIVNGLRVVNNATGIEIRHTGWYANGVSFSGNGSTTVFNLPAGYLPTSVVYVGGVLQTVTTDYTIVETLTGATLTFVTAPPAGTNNITVYKSEDGSLPEIIDEDGNLIVYTGVSPTARNITLANIEIVAPREVVHNAVTYPALYGIRIRSYENVQITNIQISDGTLDLAGDYQPSTALSSGIVARFYNGVSKLSIKNFAIYGFADEDYGYRMTSSALGPFVLDGFVSIDGPDNPIRLGNASYKGLIQNYMISGNKPTNAAIYVTNPNIQIGQGFATGYFGDVVGGIGSDDDKTPCPITYVRTARSTANTATTPVAMMQFNWQERSQDLGAGEGLKISWGAQLVADSIPTEFGWIGFQKSTSSDNKVSDFAVANTTDGGASVTAGSFVVNQRYKIATIGTTDFTLIGASANKVGLEFVASGVGTGTGTAITVATPYFVVEAAGPTRPGTDNNKSLGTASFRWSQVFAGNGTINTSDAREKQQVRDLEDAEKAVALRCKGLLRAFKFNDAVAKKGDAARIHFGIIAQDLAQAFRDEGLDPTKYSMFCHDEWSETTEDGALINSGDRYGVRYEELLAFIIAVI
jgi:hypothetical protein